MLFFISSYLQAHTSHHRLPQTVSWRSITRLVYQRSGELTDSLEPAKNCQLSTNIKRSYPECRIVYSLPVCLFQLLYWFYEGFRNITSYVIALMRNEGKHERNTSKISEPVRKIPILGLCNSALHFYSVLFVSLLFAR